jgi:VanZ family protein
LAATTELLQVWIPGRTPRISDLLADLVGMLAGLALLEGTRWGAVRLRSRRFSKGEPR